MKMGDVADFSNFVGAVIDAGSFATQKAAIEEAKASSGKAQVIAGGGYDDSDGWFVQPTVIETSDPDFRTMKEELFGPVVTAFVYDDSRYEDTLDLIDNGTTYGLTGAVFARDLGAIETDAGPAPLRRGQLLRQRQADGSRRRPAAVRRRARLRHERQGRLDVEPDPLGQPAHDQGDVRAAARLPLPVPRVRRRVANRGRPRGRLCAAGRKRSARPSRARRERLRAPRASPRASRRPSRSG